MSTCNRWMEINHLVTLFSLVLLLSHLVLSTLRVTPTDTTVLAGDSIVFNCSGTRLIWRYHKSNPRSDKDVYINGKLLKEFVRNGFRIDGDQTLDEVNLVIENVTVDLAGKYECRDIGGDSKSAHLTVHESIPICQTISMSGAITERTTCNSLHDDSLRTRTNGPPQHEFIGPNTCGIPQDQILLSCSVTYSGNDTPVLELRNRKENKAIESCCRETVVDANKSLKSLTCNAIMVAELDLDGAQFICQINQPAQKQYNCTTEPIKIQYSFHGKPSIHQSVQLGNEVNCTANCSQPHDYNWIWSEKTDLEVHLISWRTKILNVTRPGSHICNAECQIGKHSCTVTAKSVEVSSSTLGGQFGEQAQWKLPIVGAIITIVVVAGSVAIVTTVVLRLRRRRRNQTLTDDNENQPEAQSLQMSQVQEMAVEPQRHET